MNKNKSRNLFHFYFLRIDVKKITKPTIGCNVFTKSCMVFFQTFSMLEKGSQKLVIQTQIELNIYTVFSSFDKR